MKKWIIVWICLVIVVVGSGLTIRADEFSKTSSTDTTVWSTDQTLTSDYIIYENETLIVEPGVTIYLDEDVSIFVFGTLQAEGTEEESITFTNKDVGEYWGFIRFEPSSVDENCSIKYTIVEYATQGIYCDSSSPTITDSKIMLNSNVGVYLRNSQATITGNTISRNRNMGIQCDTSSPLIYNNTISDTDNFGIYSYLSQPTISRNVISSNGNVGIYADSSPLEVHENNIYDNVAYGVYNGNPSMMVNATKNYWGASSGPGGQGPGSGDKISDGVVYNPWLENQMNLRPPSCNVLHPQKDVVLKGTVNITGSSSDVDSDVIRVEIRTGDDGWQNATGTTSWYHIWDTTPIPDGNYTIYVRAWDGRYYSNILSLPVEVDNPPTVVINEQNQTVTDGLFMMSWSTNAVDIEHYEVRSNGDWHDVGINTSYIFTLSKGKNTIYVRGIDYGGNVGGADWIEVIYKPGEHPTEPPIMIYVTIVAVVVLMGVVSAMLLKGKK